VAQQPQLGVAGRLAPARAHQNRQGAVAALNGPKLGRDSPQSDGAVEVASQQVVLIPAHHCAQASGNGLKAETPQQEQEVNPADAEFLLQWREGNQVGLIHTLSVTTAAIVLFEPRRRGVVGSIIGRTRGSNDDRLSCGGQRSWQGPMPQREQVRMREPVGG
jgi:hypothetical protein